jgi:hypothetical protein
MSIDVDTVEVESQNKRARTEAEKDKETQLSLPPPPGQGAAPQLLKRSARAALSDDEEERRAKTKRRATEGTEAKEAAVDVVEGKKRKGKGKAAVVGREGSPVSSSSDSDSYGERYLRVKPGGRKKLTSNDVEFNKQFNKLKIVRPDLKAPKIVAGQKVGWADRDLDEEELREAAAWDMDASKSFFRIRTLKVPSKEERDGRRHRVADAHEEWRGVPNFKAFRPVSLFGLLYLFVCGH